MVNAQADARKETRREYSYECKCKAGSEIIREYSLQGMSL